VSSRVVGIDTVLWHVQTAAALVSARHVRAATVASCDHDIIEVDIEPAVVRIHEGKIMHAGWEVCVCEQQLLELVRCRGTIPGRCASVERDVICAVIGPPGAVHVHARAVERELCARVLPLIQLCSSGRRARGAQTTALCERSGSDRRHIPDRLCPCPSTCPRI
jgi:hypothetical protein